MKKSLVIYLFIFLINCSFGLSQNKHMNHNISNIDFMFHFGPNDFDVFFGQHSYRQMYFDYKPKKGTWKLKKDIVKKDIGFIFGFYPNAKVVARFENPHGGKDFVIRINRNGYWAYNGPNKWFNVFKKKIVKNL
mgnify:CR=1 FL=1|tara:strand:- start:291 stop:692 length:402 start_codon:yes stop_codon:yes gene_type:complete